MLSKLKITTLLRLIKELRSQGISLAPAREGQTGGYRKSQLTKVEIHRQKPQEPIPSSFYLVPHVQFSTENLSFCPERQNTQAGMNQTWLG